MKAATILQVLLLSLCSATLARSAVTFDWARVGNAGNAGDVQTQGTFGKVDYTYRISKHEVTNAQYAEFLNTVDPTGANALSLYSTYMSSDSRGGINFNGSATNGSKFEIKLGRDNNPVVFVSFFDAMRFVNWLENGQGSGSTESGVYTIVNDTHGVRSRHAAYFIPSEAEWYKAAYHKNDGITGNYWDYPTSSDTEPYSDEPPGGGAPDPTNTANFAKTDGIANGYDDGFAVTGSTTFVGGRNYLTDVGAYSQSMSPYGTFDQGGNVFEWNDAIIDSYYHIIRGGSWLQNEAESSVRFNDGPGGESAAVGFRVASVPEPRAFLLAIGLMGAALVRSWRSCCASSEDWTSLLIGIRLKGKSRHDLALPPIGTRQ